LQHKWGDGERKRDVVPPGGRKWFWWTYAHANNNHSPKFHVQFDSDLHPGKVFTINYDLKKNAAPAQTGPTSTCTTSRDVAHSAPVSVVLLDLGGVLVEFTGPATLLRWLGDRLTPEQIWADVARLVRRPRLRDRAVAVVPAAAAISDGEVRRIRLCADPSNPPFSARSETEPGFEVEVARAIAQALGAELGVHWFPAAREIMALRQLYEERCDVFMGLPLTPSFRDDKPRLLFSAPYYVMRQVIVSPTVGGVRSLDELRGKLVGVQAMTLGDRLVFERGEKRKVYRNAEEVLTALVGSEVDAVVIESPFGGRFATKNPGFRIVEIIDPARDLPIGAAVRRTDPARKDQIDQAIGQLKSKTLPDIFARYGIGSARSRRARRIRRPAHRRPRPARRPRAISRRLRRVAQGSLCRSRRPRRSDSAAVPACHPLQHERPALAPTHRRSGVGRALRPSFPVARDGQAQAGPRGLRARRPDAAVRALGDPVPRRSTAERARGARGRRSRRARERGSGGRVGAHRAGRPPCAQVT
jgi:ABC-type amino acid transport substrate-binding protein